MFVTTPLQTVGPDVGFREIQYVRRCTEPDQFLQQVLDILVPDPRGELTIGECPCSSFAELDITFRVEIPLPRTSEHPSPVLLIGLPRSITVGSSP